MVSQSADVLIVGAGAAGLAAALELGKAGRTVLILEGRDRAGGRINTTFDHQSGMPYELGPEFIHGRSQHIFEVVDRHNIPIYEISGEHLYLENGKLHDDQRYSDQFERILARAKSDSGPDRTFADFLKDITFADEETIANATTYVEDYNAADAGIIGLKGLAQWMKAGDEIYGDHMYRFVNGYSSVVDCYLKELPQDRVHIRLNTRVKQVSLTDEGAEIEALEKDGTDREAATKYTGQKAIITVPLNILKASAENGGIRFLPELDEKRACLDKIHMGRCDPDHSCLQKSLLAGNDVAGTGWKQQAFFQRVIHIRRSRKILRSLDLLPSSRPANSGMGERPARRIPASTRQRRNREAGNGVACQRAQSDFRTGLQRIFFITLL